MKCKTCLGKCSIFASGGKGGYRLLVWISKGTRAPIMMALKGCVLCYTCILLLSSTCYSRLLVVPILWRIFPSDLSAYYVRFQCLSICWSTKTGPTVTTYTWNVYRILGILFCSFDASAQNAVISVNLHVDLWFEDILLNGISFVLVIVTFLCKCTVQSVPTVYPL